MSSRLIAPKVGSRAATTSTEAVGVARVHLDVEHVDAGEFLEEDGLALHHRLAGERADIAEPEHGGAVGDDRDQVAARGVVAARHRGWRRSPRRRRRRRANRRAPGRAAWPCAWSARSAASRAAAGGGSRAPPCGNPRPSPCLLPLGAAGSGRRGRAAQRGRRNHRVGSEECGRETRTSTGFPPQAPQACASTIPPRPHRGPRRRAYSG